MSHDDYLQREAEYQNLKMRNNPRAYLNKLYMTNLQNIEIYVGMKLSVSYVEKECWI